MSATKAKPEWRNRIVSHGEQPANQFLAHEANARRHPAAQRDALRGSLDTLGWVGPVIVSLRTGKILDGHARIEEALSRDENAPVPFVEVDVDEAEEKQILAVYDPITGLAAYDREALDGLLRDVQTGDPALQEMLAGLAAEQGLEYGEASKGQPGGDPEAVLNRAEELKQKYGVAFGQLWQVGRHRVMCGDSYSDADIEWLLAGERPAMLNTDPPYGVNIVQPRNSEGTADSGGSKPFGSTSSSKRKTGIAERNARAERVHVQHGAPSRNQIIQSNKYPVIEGDDHDFDPSGFLDRAPIVIFWGANYYADKLPTSPCWIVWDKREDITRNTFADCEMAWCNLDKPARLFHHLWNGLHKGSQHGQRRTHPTEKPVALFEEIGRMFCPEGLWLDLFAGTGAQVIAAETVGARCYAMDSEPLYVATTLERLSMLNLEPKLVA